LIPMEAWVQKFVECLMIRLVVEEPATTADWFWWSVLRIRLMIMTMAPRWAPAVGV
jgi:hypothetical protein